MSTSIVLEDVGKQFDGASHVLRGINLRIAAGEIVSFPAG